MLFDSNFKKLGSVPYICGITPAGSLVKWVECSPMVQKTGVHSWVESYEWLKNMVLDTSFLNTQHYKVRIKGKVEQSREMSSALPYTLVW